MHGERTDRRYKLYIKIDMERKKITFDSFIRGSIGCVLVVGILMLVERLSGVLLPFFIARLIAYMVYPLVKFFHYKLRLKSRIVSIFCALFLITLVGVSLFYLLVPPMVSEIGRMNDLLVTYLTNGAGIMYPRIFPNSFIRILIFRRSTVY